LEKLLKKERKKEITFEELKRVGFLWNYQLKKKNMK
jgi:hypothetical protein